MKTFADKIITYNKLLDFSGSLPQGIRIMNPFKEDKNVLTISSQFYKKFYADNGPRSLILGINPGRFGAGLTGVPFTDPKRLMTECGIVYPGKETHEPSSVFIYEMIRAFGGPARFYKRFFINSVCPLGFTKINEKGKEVNYNYYDSPDLQEAVSPFIIDNIRKLVKMGVNSDVCICFGTGKNEKFLRRLNDEHQFFGKIIALEHPRFIMQYKAKTKQQYIEKYLEALKSA
jgi:hypothetical protein